MSNATAPLMSLADSLDSLRQRLGATDERKYRVLRGELNARSLSMSITQDHSNQMVQRIVDVTAHVAVCLPIDANDFERTVIDVEELLQDLA
jgi:hypothetical protein